MSKHKNTKRKRLRKFSTQPFYNASLSYFRSGNGLKLFSILDLFQSAQVFPHEWA